MNPKAFESKQEEGRDRVAKCNQMLNMYRNALGWDLIVRTPKPTYLPKKKILVKISSKVRTTHIVIARNGPGPRMRKPSG